MINEEVKWKKGRKDLFRRWMHQELFNTIGDRQSLELKWRNQLIQWRARVIGDGISDVPFAGASDLELPLTAMHTDPIFADFMQTLHVPPEFWSLQAKRPDRVDYAKPLQEFLAVVEAEDLRMRAVNEQVLLDLIIHGTGIYKDFILHEGKKVLDYNEAGNIEEQTRITFKAACEHVPLQDFFIPAYAAAIDPDVQRGAPWVAHRFDLRPAELRRRASGQAPFMPNYDPEAVELVVNYDTDGDMEPDPVEEQQRTEDQYDPYQDRYIQLYEVWARFDVDDDGIEEDIRVIWHQETEQLLSAVHPPFVHGKRPFSRAVFMPGKGFYGIGIAEMDEWAQLAGSRVLNSVIDSATLSNSIMLGVPQGSMVNPQEPIYPGRIWPLGPQDRIQEVRMGRPEPAMFQLLDSFDSLSQRRTSVTDLRQGSIDNLPSRTPASTVINLLNESNKRFDMVLNHLRDGALRQIGLRTLQNLIQISKDSQNYVLRAELALGPEDAAKVVEILQGPVHAVEDMFGVSVTATSSQINREIEKQSLISLMETLLATYQSQVQYAQALSQMTQDPTPLAQTVTAAYLGIEELRKRLLESFSVPNPEAYLGSPQVQASAPQTAGAGAVTVPTQPQGAEAAPGAAILQQLLP